MTRTDLFSEVAQSARVLAELAEKQRDTVDWWTQFGAATATFLSALDKAKPEKPTHIRATAAAIRAVREGTREPERTAS